MEFFKKKKKGIGGVVFIFSAMLGVFIMFTSVHLSKISTMRAIVDNVAKLVATDTAAKCYTAKVSSFNASGTYSIGSGFILNPATKFDEIMDAYPGVSAVSSVSYSWDRNLKILTLRLGDIEYNGTKITPMEQNIIIDRGN